MISNKPTIDQVAATMKEAKTMSGIFENFEKLILYPDYYSTKNIKFDEDTGKPTKTETVPNFITRLDLSSDYHNSLPVSKNLYNKIIDGVYEYNQKFYQLTHWHDDGFHGIKIERITITKIIL